MSKFHDGSVVVEAVNWCGANALQVADFLGVGPPLQLGEGRCVELETLEGVMSASIGDWIIRDAEGEFCSCKPDIFEATYEPVKPSDG